MTTNAKLRAGVDEALCHLHGEPLRLVTAAVKADPCAYKVRGERETLSDVLEIAAQSINPDDFVELERIVGDIVTTRHLGDAITVR